MSSQKIDNYTTPVKGGKNIIECKLKKFCDFNTENIATQREDGSWRK